MFKDINDIMQWRINPSSNCSLSPMYAVKVETMSQGTKILTCHHHAQSKSKYSLLQFSGKRNT